MADERGLESVTIETDYPALHSPRPRRFKHKVSRLSPRISTSKTEDGDGEVSQSPLVNGAHLQYSLKHLESLLQDASEQSANGPAANKELLAAMRSVELQLVHHGNGTDASIVTGSSEDNGSEASDLSAISVTSRVLEEKMAALDNFIDKFQKTSSTSDADHQSPTQQKALSQIQLLLSRTKEKSLRHQKQKSPQGTQAVIDEEDILQQAATLDTSFNEIQRKLTEKESEIIEMQKSFEAKVLKLTDENELLRQSIQEQQYFLDRFRSSAESQQSESESKLSSLIAENNSLKQKFSAVNSELEKLRKSQQNNTNTSSSQSNQQSILQQNLNSLQAVFQDTKKQLDKKNVELSNLLREQQNLSKLRVDNEKMKAELQAVTEKLNSAEETIREKEKVMANLDTDSTAMEKYDKLVEELQRTKEQLESSHGQNNEHVIHLQKQVNALQDECALAKEQLHEKTLQLTENCERVSSLETSVSEYQQLVEMNESLESALLDMKVNHDSIKKELATKENSIKELLNNNQSLNESFETESESLFKEITLLKDQLANANRQLDLQQNEFQMYRNESSITGESDQAQLTMLKNSYRELENRLSTVYEELKSANKSFELKNKENLSLKQTLSQLQKEISLTNVQVSASSIDNIHHLVSSLRNENNSLRTLCNDLHLKVVRLDQTSSSTDDVLLKKVKDLQESEQHYLEVIGKKDQLIAGYLDSDDIKDKLLKENECLRSQLIDFESQLHSRQNTDNDLTAELERTLAEKSSVLRVKEEEILRLRDQISAIQNHDVAHNKDFDDLKLQLEAQCTLLSGQLNTKVGEYNALVQHYTTLYNQNDQLRNNLVQLDHKLRDSERKITAIQSHHFEENRVLSSEKERLETEVNELNEKLMKAENIIRSHDAAVQDKLIEQSEDSELLRNQNIHLKDIVRQLETSREDLDKQLEKKDIQIASLEEQLASCVKELKLAKQSSSTNHVSVAQTSATEEKLKAEIQRLRKHLVEVEESYTSELVEAEEKHKVLQEKINILKASVDQSTKSHSDTNSSYKEVSSQVATLQMYLDAVRGERDRAQQQLERAKKELDDSRKSSKNLQMVLEQFQKSSNVSRDTVSSEMYLSLKNKFGLLEKEKLSVVQELDKVKVLLEEKSQAVEAATRLTTQADVKDVRINQLSSTIESQLKQIKQLNDVIYSKDEVIRAHIDKGIVKNMIIGYLNTPNAKKDDAMRVMARFLEFSGEEMERSGLNRTPTGGGWLSWMRSPSHSSTPHEHSFTEEFVKFLEKESTPKKVVALPLPTQIPSSSHSYSRSRNPSVSRSTPPRSPLLDNPVHPIPLTIDSSFSFLSKQ